MVGSKGTVSLARLLVCCVIFGPTELAQYPQHSNNHNGTQDTVKIQAAIYNTHTFLLRDRLPKLLIVLQVSAIQCSSASSSASSLAAPSCARNAWSRCVISVSIFSQGFVVGVSMSLLLLFTNPVKLCCQGTISVTKQKPQAIGNHVWWHDWFESRVLSCATVAI